jgi:hypothetical protein
LERGRRFRKVEWGKSRQIPVFSPVMHIPYHFTLAEIGVYDIEAVSRSYV